MLISVLKSKIGHARLTAAELYYEGSITIDPRLLKCAGLIAGEKVHVLNENTGARLETYIIEGRPHSGEICLNGPAARLGFVGDTLVILSYGLIDEKEAGLFTPTIVYLDDNNQIKQ